MARYIGPKCKLCRREATKLFLKGSRCLSDKCGLTRRQQPPGVHGKSRIRLSDYGKSLREKQKVKRLYGILEKQFRRYFDQASQHTGKVGEVLLQLLETRLDSLVYSLGMALSRSHARQIVRQGKVQVQGQVVTIPSYQVKEKQLISFTDQKQTLVREVDLPKWLKWDAKKNSGSIVKFPSREQLSGDINEQLIIEYYSR